MTIKTNQTKAHAQKLSAYLLANKTKFSPKHVKEVCGIDSATWRKVREYALKNELICKTAGGYGAEYYHKDHEAEVDRQIEVETGENIIERARKKAARVKAAREAPKSNPAPRGKIKSYGATLRKEFKTRPGSSICWFSYGGSL